MATERKWADFAPIGSLQVSGLEAVRVDTTERRMGGGRDVRLHIDTDVEGATETTTVRLSKRQARNLANLLRTAIAEG